MGLVLSPVKSVCQHFRIQNEYFDSFTTKEFEYINRKCTKLSEELLSRKNIDLNYCSNVYEIWEELKDKNQFLLLENFLKKETH